MKENDLPRRVRELASDECLDALVPCGLAEINLNGHRSQLVYVGGKGNGQIMVSSQLTGAGFLDQPKQYLIAGDIRTYRPLKENRPSVLDRLSFVCTEALDALSTELDKLGNEVRFCKDTVVGAYRLAKQLLP